MIWLWVVIITALLTFCMIFMYKLGHKRGYVKGAEFVLDEWKEVVQNSEGW